MSQRFKEAMLERLDEEQDAIDAAELARDESPEPLHEGEHPQDVTADEVVVDRDRGRVAAHATIILRDGQQALVSVADLPVVSGRRWYLGSNGYPRAATGHHAPVEMHRWIFAFSAGLEIDHVDGDKLNNTRQNLRVCTRAQNACNMPKSRGTSRYKGVSPSGRGDWRAQIHAGGHQIYLGRFATQEEAALAYNRAATRLFGEFALINALRGDACAPF